jgi:hypothetical protein
MSEDADGKPHIGETPLDCIQPQSRCLDDVDFKILS